MCGDNEIKTRMHTPAHMLYTRSLHCHTFNIPDQPPVYEANEERSIVSCCAKCYHPVLFMECQLPGSGLAFGGTTEKIRLT